MEQGGLYWRRIVSKTENAATRLRVLRDRALAVRRDWTGVTSIGTRRVSHHVIVADTICTLGGGTQQHPWSGSRRYQCGSHDGASHSHVFGLRSSQPRGGLSHARQHELLHSTGVASGHEQEHSGGVLRMSEI